jgi:hypothetical protein
MSDTRLIKAALEVYRSTLARGIHAVDASQPTRDWCELLHGEVVALLERKYS